jgi:structural maintenance of chromosome 4
MINESGTMTGGGGKPRGGRMCIGSQAPRSVDSRAAAAELAAAEQELAVSQEALREARARLSDAGQQAKVAERQLAELETAIPKAGWWWGHGVSCAWVIAQGNMSSRTGFP